MKQKGGNGFAPPAPPLLIPSGYVSLVEAVQLASFDLDPDAPPVNGCSASENRLRRLLHEGRVRAQVQLYEDGACFPLPAEEWAGPRAPMFFEGEGEVFLPGDAESLTGDWALVRVHQDDLISALKGNLTSKHKPLDLSKPMDMTLDTNYVRTNRKSKSSILGRKPTYDWAEIQKFVINILNFHGLPSPDDPQLPNQAAIERRIMDHCQKRYGREPALSNVRPKLAKWLIEFKNR